MLWSAAAAAADHEAGGTEQSVGLVLSGGGAKGIAHIGVIKALEDNDIPIDYIAGTSMGSIVGAMYAMGYTPERMMELILSQDFAYWSTGTVDPELIYYFSRGEPSPAMLRLPLARADSATDARAVPASLISPLPMNFAFMQLFAPYTMQCGGDFNRLFVPFRCVASNIVKRRKQVFSSGSLGDAVRASMSFPTVFQPVEIDGELLYDGGIYDNFPVDVMRSEFHPSIMIGVDVSTEENGPQTSIIDQLENLIIQNNDYSLPPGEGIKLRLDLDAFGLLDFPAARAIYQVGYDHTMAMIDSIRSRISARRPAAEVGRRRTRFDAATPEVVFDSVRVRGASPWQNRRIGRRFTADGDTFGINQARDAYYRLLSSGKIRELMPHALPDSATGMFTLDIKASMRDAFHAGLGGYVTSSSNSYLFLSAGVSTFSRHSTDASLRAWVGQSYMAACIDGRINLGTHTPSALAVQAVVSRRSYAESDHAFFELGVPAFVVEHEYFGRLKWRLAAGRRGAITLGAGYGKQRDDFYSSAGDDRSHGRDRACLKAAQLLACYSSSTLDRPDYPTAGTALRATAMAVAGDYSLEPAAQPRADMRGDCRWVQLELAARHYSGLGRRFCLGLEADALLSTRKLLGSYDASLAMAPDYLPAPSAAAAFNPALRANSFVAAAVVPVFRYSERLDARLALHGFVPLRGICRDAGGMARYGRWLRDPEFFGEAAVTYSFPFASLAGWCNYTTGPLHGWHVGLSLGVYITAPRMLR